MLLADPSPTSFDLRFRLFGTDVRIHPLFWLITAVFGWSWSILKVLPGNGLGEVALWIACVFFSVLLHEFGHVWMGRVFGAKGHIVMHSMGGLAIGAANVPYRWQRILVSAAGPGIQLILFGVILGLVHFGVVSLPGDPWRMQFAPTNVLQMALMMLIMINFYWAMLNLLPVWPLDGGQIMREVCGMVSPRNGMTVSLWISIATAVLLCVNVALQQLQRKQEDLRAKGQVVAAEETKWKTLSEYAGLSPRFGSFHAEIYLPPITEQVMRGDKEREVAFERGWVSFGTGWFTVFFFAMFAFGSFQALMQQKQQRRRFWGEDDDQPPWRRR
jgi:Zn-dependent protease